MRFGSFLIILGDAVVIVMVFSLIGGFSFGQQILPRYPISALSWLVIGVGLIISGDLLGGRTKKFRKYESVFFWAVLGGILIIGGISFINRFFTEPVSKTAELAASNKEIRELMSSDPNLLETYTKAVETETRFHYDLRFYGLSSMIVGGGMMIYGRLRSVEERKPKSCESLSHLRMGFAHILWKLSEQVGQEYCYHCGASMRVEAKFCNECGKPQE
jgi:hypothetical protein